MLVLSRKENERLLFTVGAVSFNVCVVEIRGDKVRLGIEAPAEVRVAREEIARGPDEPPGKVPPVENPVIQ